MQLVVLEYPKYLLLINTLGLSSLSKNGIQVYPNPTERLIEISGNQLMELIIKDLSGKVIISKERTTKLDLSNIAAGIYLLEVRNENHELVWCRKNYQTLIIIF